MRVSVVPVRAGGVVARDLVRVGVRGAGLHGLEHVVCRAIG